MTHAELVQRLLENQDLKYRQFSASLLPGIRMDSLIGVRIPILRKLAREFRKGGLEILQAFFDSLPHRYFEENQIHLMLIQQMDSLDECLHQLDKFLPYVDNWSVCDGKTPRVFANTPENSRRALKSIQGWLESDHPYMVRFGVNTLMDLFLDERFDPKFLKWVAAINSEKFEGYSRYYVQMGIAWYFATALAKQWEAAFLYIECRKLGVWIHNKAIQKSIESYRVTDAHKDALRKLKI